MIDRQPDRVHRIASAVTAVAAIAVFAVAVRHGTFAAADTDPYGYLSEADLIAHGTLRVPQPLALEMPWPDADESFAPPGYRPATVRGFIVPAYPPGLPLVMAAFERVAGRDAVFFVVPLLGAAAIWATSRLAAQLVDPLAGPVAAVLLATSPAFVFNVVQPVSDVAATAWWALCLALAGRDTIRTAIVAGAAAALAILTRPNLVPVAGIIGIALLARATRADESRQRVAWVRLCCVASGILAGAVAVAAVNQYLYGSPLRSGYAPLGQLYGWANSAANLDRYPRWLVTTQTPFICLAVVAPWLIRTGPERVRRQRGFYWLLLAFSLVVFLSYLFYVPFGRDEWTYLRFLLPAYPALLALSVAAAFVLIERLPMKRPSRLALAAVLFGALATWQWQQAIGRGAFVTQLAERRYVDVGRYIAAAMPRNAVFIAGLHAGTIRYYSDRVTIRYDMLPPRWLDEAVRILASKGYHPFLALEEGEEAEFRRRFASDTLLGRLDWPAAIQRFEPISVRIYDPADRARFMAGESVVTGDLLLRRAPVITHR